MNASWTGLLWFVVVLGLIPAALWMVKRTGVAGLRRGGPPGLAQVVGSLAVGTQQRVVTIEVGEGAQRRWLVLGVTAQQINTLHVIDEPPAVAAATAKPAMPFSQALRAQLKARLDGSASNGKPQ